MYALDTNTAIYFFKNSGVMLLSIYLAYYPMK